MPAGGASWARRAGELAARLGYLVLVAGCGALAVGESLRIRRAFEAADFLAGPGGYVMVVGVALLLFALVEAGAQVRRVVRRAAQPAAAGEAAPAGTPDAAAADGRRKMQLTFALCVVFVLLVRPLGFTLAAMAYLGANMLLLGNGPGVTAATVAVVFAVLRFGVPAIGLYLPRGPFGF